MVWQWRRTSANSSGWALVFMWNAFPLILVLRAGRCIGSLNRNWILKVSETFWVLGLWSPLMWASCFLRWMTGHLPDLQRSPLIFIIRIYFLRCRMAPPEWVIPSCVCVHSPWSSAICGHFTFPACTWSPSIIYRKRHMDLKDQTGQKRQKIGGRCAIMTSETLN